MKNTKQTKKSLWKIALPVLAVLLLLGLSVGGFLYCKYYEPAKRSADLKRLQAETYQGVFLSMYAPEAFPEDVYPTYMGYDAVVCSHRIVSFGDLAKYLDTAFSSGNEVSHVFLVLDPWSLWDSSFHNNDRFSTSLDQDLLSYVDVHPDAEFTVLFSSPSLAYWQEQGAGKAQTYENVVRVLATPLDMRGNLTLYFPTGEEWLIANPDAYDTPSELNASAARSVMLSVLSGAMRYRDTETYKSLDQLDTLVQEAITSPVTYPDLSDHDIVFFGDSVLGNYQDFASIPGVISALTGAHSYNLAVGGSCATPDATEKNISFPHAVDAFLQSEDAAALSNSRSLCFVINYGLNDYFEGYSTADYAAGLQDGIRALQEAYPDAELLLVSSNYILSFDQGTAPQGAEENVLADYIAAAEETAAAENIAFLNINDVLQWDAVSAKKYLVDGIHPNEQGRFLFGVALLRTLEASSR